MVEEALRSRVPCLLIDVKGDLPNLLLSFPSFDAAHFTPWVDGHEASDETPAAEVAAALASERREQLTAWGLGAEDLVEFRTHTELRVLTPGSSSGEPLHILSSLERRSASWSTDRDAGRAALSAAISLVLPAAGAGTRGAAFCPCARLIHRQRRLLDDWIHIPHGREHPLASPGGGRERRHGAGLSRSRER